MTALQASYEVACAVLERYYADVCSSDDQEYQRNMAVGTQLTPPP
jgi:hypothetical protein